jgi:hypothetical protein
MHEIKNIIGDYDSLINIVLEHIGQAGINMEGLKIDHIAFRCATLEEYRKINSKLTPHAKLIGENIIS